MLILSAHVLPLLMALCGSQLVAGFTLQFAPFINSGSQGRSFSHHAAGSVPATSSSSQKDTTRMLHKVFLSSSDGSNTESSGFVTTTTTTPPQAKERAPRSDSEPFLFNVPPGSYYKDIRLNLARLFEPKEASPYERTMLEFLFSGIDGRRVARRATTTAAATTTGTAAKTLAPNKKSATAKETSAKDTAVAPKEAAVEEAAPAKETSAMGTATEPKETVAEETTSKVDASKKAVSKETESKDTAPLSQKIASALIKSKLKTKVVSSDGYNEPYLNNVRPGTHEAPRKLLVIRAFDEYQGSPYQRAMSGFLSSGVDGRRIQRAARKEVAIASTESIETPEEAEDSEKKPLGEGEPVSEVVPAPAETVAA